MKKYKSIFKESTESTESTLYNGYVVVKDYSPYVNDIEEMRSMAKEATSDAKEVLIDDLLKLGLKKSEIKKLKINPTGKVESDSGNWNHAVVYHEFEIKGPEGIIEKIDNYEN